MTPKFKLQQEVWIVNFESKLSYQVHIERGYIKDITLKNIGTENEFFTYSIDYWKGFSSHREYLEHEFIDSIDDVFDLIQTSVRTYYTT